MNNPGLRRLPVIGFVHTGRELQLSRAGSKLLVAAAEIQEARDRRIVQLIDVASGRVEWQKKMPQGSSGPTGFSPDGTLVAATVCGDRGAIVVWDVATGTKQFRLEGIADLGFGGRGERLAFSSDNRRLAVAMRDANTVVWDTDLADP